MLCIVVQLCGTWLDTSLKVPYHNIPRMMNMSDSYMVSAAHPLVTRRSYRLFRICSCCYITKGVIIIV